MSDRRLTCVRLELQAIAWHRQPDLPRFLVSCPHTPHEGTENNVGVVLQKRRCSELRLPRRTKRFGTARDRTKAMHVSTQRRVGISSRFEPAQPWRGMWRRGDIKAFSGRKYSVYFAAHDAQRYTYRLRRIVTLLRSRGTLVLWPHFVFSRGRFLLANAGRECEDGEGCVAGGGKASHRHAFEDRVLREGFNALVGQWLKEVPSTDASFSELRRFSQQYGDRSSCDS